MRLVFLLCVVLGFCFFWLFQIDPASENYIQLVVQMENKFEKIIYKKYGLNLIATGGQMMHNIKSLNLHFEHEGILSKDQMRTLLVDIVKLYLNEINSNIKIRPYLNVFPFTSNEIDIEIFVGNGYEGVVYPEISVGSACFGNVRFRYVKKRMGPFEQTDKETFEEAEAIVESQK